jgi:hypothetical protein
MPEKEDLMNTARFLREWQAHAAVLIGTLGLIFVVVVSGNAEEPETKIGAKAASTKVDALVNRNKPPKLVVRPRQSLPHLAALYPESYDWKEEERVR